MKFLLDFYLKAREQIDILMSLELGNVHFSDIRLSVGLGIFFAVLVLARLVIPYFRKDKYSWESSGEGFGAGSKRFIFKMMSLVAKLIFALAVAFVITALGEPFRTGLIETKKILEGRVRIDLRDISLSMEEPFPGTKISKGEAAAKAHSEFAKMREGKGDRVSFWLFHSVPHLVEDFIVDDRVYQQQVEDAYWVTGWSDSFLDNRYKQTPDYFIPREKYLSSKGGGTKLAEALEAIIIHFDRDKISLGKEGRSVLIITDGKPNKYPEEELQGLKKRKITPYIIFIRGEPEESEEDEMYGYGIMPAQNQLPDVVTRIGEYGGKYFDASDEDSLKRAFEEIDKLEKIKFEVKNTVIKIPLFQTFIFVAVILFLLSITLGVLVQLFAPHP